MKPPFFSAFLRFSAPLHLVLVVLYLAIGVTVARAQTTRPDIVLLIADDQSWLHTSFIGDPAIKTPTFDRVAREGVYFSNEHCIASSCTPSRAAILTGRPIWQLEEGATLWGTLSAKFVTYPDVLEKAGYHVGFCWKGWGPGEFKPGGRSRNPAGPGFKNFDEFFKTVPAGEPLCFWMGSHHPHRPYEKGIGAAHGIDLSKVRVPPELPDVPEVRSDIADYLYNVQLYDSEAGHVIDVLEKAGRLPNALVVMTSDNGMPFPHGKSTLYELGTHMPMAIRWPAKVKGGRTVDDLISHIDLAPTFYEAAGVEAPKETVGKSLMPLLTSDKSGQIDPSRDRVFLGNERHAAARVNMWGYPRRAIRTHDFLYIHNYEPDRWPAGDPPRFADVDPAKGLGESGSKDFILAHRDEDVYKPFYEMAFAKHGAEELFDLKADPAEMHNVADDPKYADIKRELRAALDQHLKDTGDPRATGGEVKFDSYPYYNAQGKTRNPAPAPFVP